MLVLSTTILFPLMQMLVLLYLLLPFRHDLHNPHDVHNAHDAHRPGVKILLRLMQIVRPWGMVEVFLLGVLVALVKLSNMAAVVPGVALWAFGALTILLTVVVSFNPRYLWRILVSERRNVGESTP
jgi:paraquat-inducible protein A